MRKLTFDLLIYFATNPDEALTVRDIATKFDVASTKPVYETADTLMRDGYIRREQLPAEKGRAGPAQNLYHAGPRLLDVLLK